MHVYQSFIGCVRIRLRIIAIYLIRLECPADCEDHPGNTSYPTALHNWELRRYALLDGTRREYLNVLEKRKLENLAYMKKKRMI